MELEQWINRNQEPIGNKEGRQVIWQRTPMKIISTIYFHLNRVESVKEDHPQLSETSKGSYLELELSIFVKIFKFWLVSQSI